jgi:hypothetical protein
MSLVFIFLCSVIFHGVLMETCYILTPEMIIDIYVNSLLPVELSKPEFTSRLASLLLACFAAICKLNS